MGYDGFVLKPVDQAALLEAVGRRLGLVWRTVDPDAQPVVAPRAAGLPPAAEPFRAELTRLARAGNIKALARALDQLDTDVPAAAGITVRLRAALAEFDLAKFAKLLDVG